MERNIYYRGELKKDRKETIILIFQLFPFPHTCSSSSQYNFSPVSFFVFIFFLLHPSTGNWMSCWLNYPLQEMQPFWLIIRENRFLEIGLIPDWTWFFIIHASAFFFFVWIWSLFLCTCTFFPPNFWPSFDAKIHHIIWHILQTQMVKKDLNNY